MKVTRKLGYKAGLSSAPDAGSAVVRLSGVVPGCALCVALFASVLSLAGATSPVLAQDASAGPFTRVWAKKLASGNVEFGVAVTLLRTLPLPTLLSIIAISATRVPSSERGITQRRSV